VVRIRFQEISRRLGNPSLLACLAGMAAGAQTGAKPFAAAAACVFFAPHPGYFEAVWKPAYIFDILCATFCLLSLLSYVRGRWIVSFLCFWLAYKGKELAVMLPFVLAAYEHCF